MNKKGVALILGLVIIVVMSIMGSAMISRSINEGQTARRHIEAGQAFWIAEAGVNRALNELKTDYSITGSNLWSSTFGQGRYSIDVNDSTIDGQACKIVTARGAIPPTGAAQAERVIEVVMRKYIPPDFYDNAIYSASDVDLNGNSYSVTGDIRYANNIDNTGNVTGTITQDPSISPLAMLDFEQLLSISQSQQQVYEYVGNQLKNIYTGSQSFPPTFWYTRGDDGLDNDGDGTIDEQDEWVPNVVYVNGDLQLNGNIGTIGGFFVVVGDVINTPDVTQDAVINGNGMIEGTIYTRGTFRVNGGAGNLNINGGVWAGEEARLNGNANVTYNATYMNAIKMLNINSDVQIISWRDTQNPFDIN